MAINTSEHIWNWLESDTGAAKGALLPASPTAGLQPVPRSQSMAAGPPSLGMG